MTTVGEHFGIIPNHTIPSGSREFYCGCEFEIEDLKDIKHKFYDLNIVMENDESLRNNGKEFKTPPLTREQTLEAFIELHECLVLGPQPFSERTSIHVHVNVQSLPIKSLRNLVLSYALVEPLLFEFVGNIRKDNIYCVPLNYTYLPSRYHREITQLLEIWHKYTALNLLPVSTINGGCGLGTVEFRHLYGTKNFDTFSTWLKTIEELYSYVNNNDSLNLIEELLTKDINTLVKTIVPTLAAKWDDNYIKAITMDSVIDVKLSDGGLSK